MPNKLLIVVLIMLVVGCKNSNNDVPATDTDDRTPIAREELSDLEPDTTLNDLTSVLEILEGSADYDAFHKALKSAQMVKTLDSIDDVTIFAPISLNRISDSQLAHLKTPSGREELRHLMQYHLVEDEYDFDALKSTILINENILRLKTFNGGYIALIFENGNILITDELGYQSKIVKPDQEAENGVVHGISEVLVPQ